METFGLCTVLILSVLSVMALIGLIISSFDSAPYRINKLFGALGIVLVWLIVLTGVGYHSLSTRLDALQTERSTTLRNGNCQITDTNILRCY